MDELQSLIARLGLEPLPNEGGWFRRYCLSEERNAAGRPLASAIHFLMSPEGFSALHRLQTPEVWTFREGAPVKLLLLAPDGSGRTVKLGASTEHGETAVVTVDGGTWQAARTCGDWSLVDCRMEPAWDEREFELGGREELIARYPAWAEAIRTVTRKIG